MENIEMKALESKLNEMNSLIDASLQLALPDFMQITSLLKKVSAKVTLQDNAVRSELELIIKELQYYDTFKQKMDHITKIHEWILSDLVKFPPHELKSQSPTNLLRLNHLQFQVSCFDYLSSVNMIETTLVKEELLMLLGINNANEIFKHTHVMLSASRQINIRFQEAEKIAEGLSAVDLHAKLEPVYNLYSMQSERGVLDAYLNKPTICESEIQMQGPANIESSTIDLF
jgi:hypothetical protein